MEVDLIFKIAAIGIIVAVLNQLLKRAEIDDRIRGYAVLPGGLNEVLYIGEKTIRIRLTGAPLSSSLRAASRSIVRSFSSS